MKILLCAGAFGYGGAETHILELASGLCSLGHRVCVASPAGALSKALPAGITHITLPRFSRTPLALLRSSYALARLIRRGGFDVVHAHARIPALLCRKPAQKYGCAFVVTAHAMFKMTPALRRMSVWGERTIAVSEDIKQLICDKCGVYPDHVTVIPNGIDTKRFSPRRLPPDTARRILFVSRMDADCSLAAQLLCRVAGKLRGEFPGIRITLTGGGSDYERIRALAEGINTACGESVINVTGARYDVENLLADADIFVGVSRAALEAAACGIPVILAGNEGYGGIFTPQSSAAESNLCARGHALPDADTLYRDIRRIILMDAAERRSLGSAGREYVLRNHSSASVAVAVTDVYRALLSVRASTRSRVRAHRAVICGYYGFGNSGDNAILDALIGNLRNNCPSVSISVICAKPRKSARRFGVKCVNRLNPFSVCATLLSSSYFILGGGTLLQNATSPRSLSYYLNASRLAMLLGCRLIVCSSGLGPLYGHRARRRVAGILNRATFVGLREPSAYDMFRSLGLNTRHAAVYADPALLTKPASESRISYLLSEFVGKGSNTPGITARFIAVSLRRSAHDSAKKPDDGFCARLASSLDGICSICRAVPLFFVLSPDDAGFTRIVRERMSERGVVLPPLTPSETVGMLSSCIVAVGMRLHLLVFALAAGVPATGINCDPKIAAFLEHAGLPEPMPDNLPSPGRLISQAVNLAESREELGERLCSRTAQLTALASEEFKIISEIIN